MGLTMAGRQADLVMLSVEDRTFLEAQVRRDKAPRSLSDRCRMVLLCAEGLQSRQVAERLGVHEHTVGKWHRRFVQDGIEGLSDEYRAGRPRTISDTQVAQVIERRLNTTPKDATHWSIRSMAAEAGLSHTTIRRIWGAFGLQPHRSYTKSH
jgi:putative transposase